METLSPRSPDTQELEKVLSFLDAQLRNTQAWSIAQEYPTALNEQNRHNISIILSQDQSEVLSHALLKPQICKTPYAIYQIGAIGSVVTHPNHRNQGLSRKNILKCLEYAEQQNCDLAVLWTDQHDFYRKFDFELAGFEYTYVLNTPPPLKNKDAKFIKGSKIDPQALLRLYNNHTVCSTRTPEDVRKFLNIPNSNVYSLWSIDNQLLAYAIEGKGADLQSYIHEWGGQVDHITDLFHHIMISEKKAYTIMCPRHSVNLRNHLMSLAAHMNIEEKIGYLGMIKILNPTALLQKVKKAFIAEGMPDVVFEIKEGQFVFGNKQNIYTLNNINDLTQLLFGPMNIENIDFIDAETKKVLSKLLPLPLWIWGWDSI